MRDRDTFTKRLNAAAKDAGLRLKAPERKAILSALGERDPDAEICRDSKGNPEPDLLLRDTENVPLKEDVDEYMEREVFPYVPDAWVDYMAKPRSATKSRSIATSTSTSLRAHWRR